MRTTINGTSKSRGVDNMNKRDDYDHLIWRIERYKHFIKKCRTVDDMSRKLMFCVDVEKEPFQIQHDKPGDITNPFIGHDESPLCPFCSDSEERPTKWYEKIPFEKTPCWVSNTHKNPVEGYTMRVITGYQKGHEEPFCSGGGKTWKYVVPLTNEEMLKYTLEEQEHEQ